MGLLYEIAISKKNLIAADYIYNMYLKETEKCKLEILPDFYEPPKAKGNVKVIAMDKFSKRNSSQVCLFLAIAKCIKRQKFFQNAEFTKMLVCNKRVWQDHQSF